MEEEEEKKKKKEEGVLLYYKYASVPDLDELLNFYNSNCKYLSLRGRVRLAPHGVNVTVGGRLSCLEQHIAAVKTNSLFEGTDFKLAACSLQSDVRIMEECGFTSLSIRVVKELVTFSSNLLLKSPDISNAGKHLSAVEFNTVLHSAGASSENNCTDQHNKIILLDARNVYETRIGRFETPKVENLDPKIRQYSDLCTWIDSHSEQLRGNSVLMYCTGGIRCEMASAYLRSKGAGFENVFQLYGGIQRYLEQFPNGGFFKGKNFVFDPRISVGCSDADIVGSCLLCESPFDDYSSRCRCVYCRMLVLVCDDCKKHNGAKYVCELCQKHSKKGVVPLDKSCSYQTIMTVPARSGFIELESTTLLNHTTFSHQLPLGPDSKPSRKLKILCLHGFRQNASNFKGRTASLAKKLKNVVELVYIDAPHELPFIFRPRTIDTSHTSIGLSLSEQGPPPSEKCKKRFAWLVEKGRNNSAGTNWESAEEPFDTLQYKKQTDGYGVSLSYLKEIFLQMGPFDGVLGFSQGAAMAASLCADKEKLKGEIDFSFAILSSGYSLNLEGLDTGTLDIPSLHIFGNHQGKDRQISCQESKTLASLFKESCSTIITHESGHIIPTQPSYIDQIKLFLDQFI